jgi:hypothetical protein
MNSLGKDTAYSGVGWLELAGAAVTMRMIYSIFEIPLREGVCNLAGSTISLKPGFSTVAALMGLSQ